MVNIITGSINSGKTSRLLKLYKDIGRGDGFISYKNMKGNIVLGYDVMQLSNGQRQPIVRRKDNLAVDWHECCEIGPYSFSNDAITWVEKTLRQLRKENVSPIYLDEIGPLELNNQCFHKIFKELLGENCELYISVRQDSLSEVIHKYQIKEKRLIYTK
ncbi:nucleoside-triphosphatase [Vallitalea okinawensis]|uniref:nucleoside-triphosphatase n=1 Tax=Vallitalea okinawensis TaxID=2078660 RepID=UPI001300A752|nr:nucleoside-triphosphatase [Vallitalea okinawensis]